MNYTDCTGKTVEEAVEKGLKELGITKEKRQAVEQETYFHILGMRKTAAPLKAALEKAGPVYTSHKGLKESPLVGAQIDATAHEIYCTMHALPVGGKMIVL